MALPFLQMSDIDEAYEELKSDLPQIETSEEGKFQEFISYFLLPFEATHPFRGNRGKINVLKKPL